MNIGAKLLPPVFVGAVLAWAQAPVTLTRGPYLQSIGPHAVTLVCRTSASSVVTLRYGEHAGPPWDFQATSVSGQDHVFELAELRPETSYAYELVSGSTVLAEGARFRTVPPAESRAPFRFLAWGDSGTGGPSQLQVVQRMEAVRPAPEFALGLGDLVYPDGDWEDYDPHFFAPMAGMLPRIGFWAALGNHDASTQNGAPYFAAFYLPTASGAPGMPSGTEHFYSFDHGMAHFTCLDSEESSHAPGSPMYAWLEADLQHARTRGKRWLIVFMHAPPYTHGTHDSDDEGALVQLRRNLVPVFEANGVDLVLCGHSHDYERSFLARGDAILQGDLEEYTKVGTSDGTIYVVTGCGGKSGSGTLDHPLMARSYGDVLGFSWVDVTWETLRGSFTERDGTTTDVFTLHKAADSTGPRIAALDAPAADELHLVFDEPVEPGAGPTGAESAERYRLFPAMDVLAATLDTDRRTVRLHTESLPLDRGYQLSVLGVADAHGNPSSPRGWFVRASTAPGRPHAEITAPVRTANAPALLAFSAARSGDDGGPLTSVRWDFGDGSPIATGLEAEHLFEEPGIYSVGMVATDGSGLQAIDHVQVRIHAQGAGPVVALSPQVLTVPAGDHVVFRSTGTHDPDGGAPFFSWDFGDPVSGAANHSSLASPSHAFATAGTYTVVLTVVDDEGSTALASAVVTVTGSAAPGPVFHPVADAMVKSTNALDNYGAEPVLRVRGAAVPEYRSFLRFHVHGLDGVVSSARLRLYAIDGADDGGTLYGVDQPWNEGTITWGNAPALGGAPLDAVGAVPSATWVELDVTDIVTGEGEHSFALSSTTIDSTLYSSREGPYPPELALTVVEPAPDTTAPVVLARDPAPGATAVSRSTSVTAVFDEPVQGVDGASFLLRRGATPVAAAVAYDAVTRTARLEPAEELLSVTTYTAQLTQAITDDASEPNELAPVSWSFTTTSASSVAQTFAPLADAQVKSSSPGVNYGFEAELRVRAPTPEYRSFLRFDVGELAGPVDSARLRLFALDGALDGGELYAASAAWTEAGITWANAPTVGGSVVDAAGTVVAGSWIELDVTALVDGPGTYAFALSSTSTDSSYYSSREGPDPPQLVVTSLVVPTDMTAPTIVERSPAPGATLVPRDTPVTVAFDEPVQGVDGLSFVLRRGSTPVASSVTYQAGTRTAVLDPAANLLAGTTYTVALTADIADLAPVPNALVPVGWSFTTVPASPGTHAFPALADASVKSTSPGTNYGADPELRVRAPSPEYRTFVRFHVTGIEGDVSAAHLRVFATRDTTSGGQLFPVAGGWSEPSITWSNAPAPGAGPLASAGAAANGTWVEYDVTAHVTGEGVYSLVLLSPSTDSFFFSSREGAHAPELVVTIEVPEDSTPPGLVSREPPPDATAVATEAPVTVVFDEPVQGVSGATFLLQRGAQPVAASVHYDASARTAVLDPVFDLHDGVVYTVALTAGIADLAAAPNALVPESWSFTTAPALATTLVVSADADAQVKSSAPGTNFGVDPTLRVRAPTPEYRTYVRFDVAGVQGTVTSATLRLYATDATDQCGTVYRVTQAWTENGITWNAAPAVDGGPLDAPGATTAERWVDFDVTGAVTGDGLHSFALFSSSVDSAIYASREGGHPPELVLELAGGTSAGPRPLPATAPQGPPRSR